MERLTTAQIENIIKDKINSREIIDDSKFGVFGALDNERQDLKKKQ
ncbi:hypothetical protein [Lederbergia citrea]|nr:hypothetical protein [Lederbergia citrea]MBS4203609.1 hypothetical protein [Lederbergia citrea]